MNNPIWKTRDEEPKKYPILALGDDGKYYVLESPKLGTGDLGWKHRCHDYIKHYCYLDDLIAQANMAKWLEEENETMREEFEVWHGNHKCTLKDLKIAQQALEKIANETLPYPEVMARETLAQIKNNNNFNNYS